MRAAAAAIVLFAAAVGAVAVLAQPSGFRGNQDVQGSFVVGLQGYPVSSVTPTDQYVLTWDLATLSWRPKAVSGGGTIPTLSGNNAFSGTLNTFSGHVAAGTSSPALTSCGGGTPTIVGDDKDGLVTMGTSATGCVITFAVAYTAVPLCTVTWQATPLAAQSYATVAASITLTQTSTSSNKVNYHCTAQNGG